MKITLKKNNVFYNRSSILSNLWQKIDTFIHSFKSTDEYIQQLTLDHEKSFDPKNIRDFVDMTIEMRTKNKGNVHFSGEVFFCVS